jgi:hypothetical protein
MQNEMGADGFSHEDIAQAVSLAQRAFLYARTGTGWRIT